MQAKYTLALILALQVSMSLCEIPTPSAELVAKLNEIKGGFFKRLLNAYNKAQTSAGPMVQHFHQSQHGQNARDFIQGINERPEFQAFVKLASALVEEAAPLVEKAHTALLGLYGQYIGPHISDSVNNAIEGIKPHLDKVLPAE